MPKAYEQMYDTSSISIPPNFLPKHTWDFGEFTIRDEMLAGFPRTKPEVKSHLRDYYAMITHMDAQIGRIIMALIESGEYENTIIVFAGDNGLAIGQHGLMGKQNLYEHSIGVPFIISGPGIPKNEKREALLYLYDVFPTLCELVNIESPNTVQGQSFTTSLKNANKSARESMIYGYKEFMRAYRKGNFKLIEYFVKGERNSQFFNLKQDPHEINNLFDQKEYSSNYLETKKEMIQEMKILSDTNQIYTQFLKE
jgi:arylsulfatase A-like enzyme